MNQDALVLTKAAELSRHGRSYVLITVIKAEGSAPRGPGAKMLWVPGTDAEDRVGTVGGGRMEYLVLEAAGRYHRERKTGIERYALDADAGQCCGGAMQVFFEYHGSPARFVLFGAGHVGKELVHTLRDADLAITVVDDRAEWNSKERFPDVQRLMDVDAGVRFAHELPESTLVCVMTYSHDLDLDIIRKVLAVPTAYMGLIGSASKRATHFSKLVESGYTTEQVEQVHCPIGIGKFGKAPSLVAVSIAAELLMEAQRIGRS
ncbi:MAG: xanthine dehydrogenase accessory protein XdhC [Phycisphaerales bacterium]|nr:xanthine dehydrogenase accessory protein XdhC [Phycisphaerales bacterium]